MKGNYTCGTGEKRTDYVTVVGKYECKRELWRPRLRWKKILYVLINRVAYGVWTECIWIRKVTNCGV
jgi:hypothetical protein